MSGTSLTFGELREVLTRLANAPREQCDIDERESFIDATFASAKGAGGNGRRRKVL